MRHFKLSHDDGNNGRSVGDRTAQIYAPYGTNDTVVINDSVLKKGAVQLNDQARATNSFVDFLSPVVELTDPEKQVLVNLANKALSSKPH